MANEAIVKSLKGKAFLQDAKGNVKELEVGDLVNLGDNIYPEGADEASFVLNLPNDKTLEVKDTKSFTLTQEALDGVAASDNADELNDIQKAILAGENLDELDATAAGGAPAAGGGGGVSLGAAGFDAGGHYANVNASMGQLGAGVGTDAVTASTPISGYNPQGGGTTGGIDNPTDPVSPVNPVNPTNPTDQNNNNNSDNNNNNGNNGGGTPIDNTAPSAPDVDAKADGSVEITPKDDSTKTEFKYTDEDGNEHTSTATKDKDTGKWSSTDTNVVVDKDTGKITIPADKVKDNSEVTAKTTDDANHTSPEAKATAADTHAPSAPDVDAKADGSVEITPKDDSTKTEFKYTDEDGNEHTSTATKDKDTGKWSSTDTNVVVDKDTGKITIPADKVKDNSEVTAKTTDDANHTSPEAKATAADTHAPSAPDVDAKADGSVEITPKDDSTKTEFKYTDEDGNEHTSTATKDKDTGKWSSTDTNVVVDKDTGKITIPADKVKDNSEVTAKTTDDANHTSPEAKATAADTHAPSAPDVDAKADGSVEITPKDDSTKTEFKYTDEDGNEHTSTATKDKDTGKWSSTDTNVVVDKDTGKITIPADKVKDNSEVTAKTTDDANHTSPEAKATAADTHAPSAPDVDAKADGSVEITPKDDSTKTEFKYTDEDGNEHTSTATKDKDTGKWSSTDTNVVVDKDTGKITIPADKVKDNSEVTAKTTDDANHTSPEAKATAADTHAPSAPDVDAKADGSVEITPKDDSTKTEFKYTDEDGNEHTSTATKDKDTGKWSSTDTNVVVDKDTGKITIPADKVKDNSEVTAKTTDDANHTSPEAKATAADTHAPSAPDVDAKADGSVEITPKDDSTKTEFKYTDEDGNEHTSTATKDKDTGKWSSTDTNVVVDKDTGKITIPADKVKDNSEVTAKTTDDANHTSPEAKATAADTHAPSAPDVDAKADGSVEITPKDDSTKTEFKYTDEDGNEHTSTATKDKDTGKWSSTDTNVVVDKDTGKITIPADKVKDNSEVTAKTTDDANHTSPEAKATAADTHAPSAPDVDAKADGSVEITPKDDSTKTEFKYTDEDGNEHTSTATKDKDTGKWSSTDTNVVVDKDTGKITIPADKVKDNSEVTAKTTDDANHTSPEAKATAADTHAPSAPDVDAKADGSVEITPKDDSTKTEFKYTDEDGNEHTSTATKDKDTGKWSSTDTNVVVDKDTGKITIPADKVKDNSEVTAKTTDDANHTSPEAKATAADTHAPSAPDVDAKADGSVEITPKDDSTKTEFKYTDEDGNEHTSTATKDKDTGKWSSTDTNVVVDKDTGKITIPADKVKDNSEVTAKTTDDANHTSPEAKATAADTHAPIIEVVSINDDVNGITGDLSNSGTKLTGIITDDSTPTITFRISAPDVNKATIAIGDANISNGRIVDNGNDTYTYTPTLGEDGAYNITITASDIAGNPAEPVSVGITLDTTPPAEPQPVIETVGKNNGYINKDNITPQGASKDNMVTITGSVTGAKVGDTVSIEIDGASKGTGKVALKDGKLGFTVEVKGDDLINATTKSVTAKVTTSDEAGNTSTGTSAPKSYNVDTYLPEPTIDTKHANGDVTIDPYGGTKGGANGKEESDVSNIRVAFSTPENTGGSKDGLVVAANKNEKGEWKISDVKGANKDSVSINETTGVITLKAGSVKEGSDIISTVKDDHGNTSIATGTVQTVPAPEVSIISVLDDTSVTIGSEKRGAGDLLSGKTLSDTLKTNDATPTIKFTVANNFESVNIKVDGVSTNVPRTALTSTVENGKAVYSYTLPQGKLGVDGAHSISVVAVNGAKSSTIEPTIHLDLDTTAGKPTIATSDDGSVSVSAPADAVVVVVGYENGKTVTAQKSGDTWSISGETPAGVSIDTTSGTVKFAAGTLSNGSSVTATAYDDVYNSNEAQAATVNIVPTPTADITAVLDNADSNRKNVSETDLSNGGSNLGSSASPIITNDNTPTIKFSVDNEFDKVKITIDGKETEVAKSSLVSEGGNVYSYTPNVSDGKHSISVVAVNGDKSQTAAVDVLNIDVDTVAPRFRASIEAPSVSEVLDTSKSTVTFKGEIIFSDTNANSTAGSGVNMDTANFNLNVSGHGLINVGKLTPVDGENGKYTYSVEVDKSVFKGATIDSTGNYAVSLQGAVQDNAGNMSNGISTNPVMVNSAILDSIDTTYKVSIQHQKGYDTDLGYASHNHLTGEIYMVDRNDDRGLNSSERQFRYIQSQMTDSNKAFTFDARSVKFGSVWSLSDGNNVTPENIKSKVDTFLSNDVQQNANSALKVYEPNANKALYNDGWGNNNSFTVKLSGYMFMRAGTYKFSGKTDDFLDFKINQSSVNKDTLQDKVVSDDGVTTKSLQKIVDTGSYDTTIVHQASTGNFTSGEIVIAKDAIYPVEIKYADTRYSAELNISYQKKVGNGSYGDSQPLSAEFNHSIYGQRGDDIKFLSKDSFAGVEFDKGAMISVTDLGQYDSLFSYQEGDVIRVTADGEALAENTKITVDGETYLVNKKGDVVINTTEKNGEYDVSLEKDTTNPNDGDKKITFEAKDVSVGETETMDITKVIDKSTGNDIYKLDVSEINDDANKSDVINAGDGNDTVIVTGSGDIDFAKLGKMVDNVEKVELGDKGQTAKGLTTTSIGDILSDASATKHLNISGLEGNKVEIGAAKEVSNSKASITSGDFSEIINSSTEQVAGESSMSIQNPTDTYAVSEAGKTLYIDIDKDLTPVH